MIGREGLQLVQLIVERKQRHLVFAVDQPAEQVPDRRANRRQPCRDHHAAADIGEDGHRNRPLLDPAVDNRPVLTRIDDIEVPRRQAGDRPTLTIAHHRENRHQLDARLE